MIILIIIYYDQLLFSLLFDVDYRQKHFVQNLYSHLFVKIQQPNLVIIYIYININDVSLKKKSKIIIFNHHSKHFFYIFNEM